MYSNNVFLENGFFLEKVPSIKLKHNKTLVVGFLNSLKILLDFQKETVFDKLFVFENIKLEKTNLIMNKDISFSYYVEDNTIFFSYIYNTIREEDFFVSFNTFSFMADFLAFKRSLEPKEFIFAKRSKIKRKIQLNSFVSTPQFLSNLSSLRFLFYNDIKTDSFFFDNYNLLLDKKSKDLAILSRILLFENINREKEIPDNFSYLNDKTLFWRS